MTDHEYGLGRVHIPDGRDRGYPMATQLPEAAPERRYRYWGAGWRGDQGATSHCVAYSLLHWLEAMGRPGDPDRWDPEWIYREAQQVDQWPGEEPDYEGTSVRAGAKILQRERLISSYRWAWDIGTIATAILTTGPVVVGTAWHDAMFTPDPDGRIRPGGGIAGGHAYLLSGVNTNDRVFRIDNSWGASWGKNGRAWITHDDMARLLAADGEACLPVPA